MAASIMAMAILAQASPEVAGKAASSCTTQRFRLWDRKVVHNTYEDRTVVKEVKGPNHSFNGQGGITAQPSRAETEASRAPHKAPTPAQASHAQEAHNNHLAAHGAAPRK